MSKQIEQKIKRFIDKYDLIQENDELILGVSGGADSMMLLHYFYTHQDQYHITLKVAHVHHGIREEAEIDAILVEQTCKKWKIPYYRHNCQIKQLAKERQMSEEEVGREERYNFFISLLNGDGKIVTAHNMNDQAETLLMRFLRGTDTRGLGGIPPQREQIIRPLLCLTRKEIEYYCEVNEVVYRDDQTNFMPIYTRNKIRLECIPYIEEYINPSITRVLGEHSHLYREEEDFLNTYTKTLFEKCSVVEEGKITIDLEKFISAHSYMQKRIILVAIESLISNSKNITTKHIEGIVSLVESQSGKCLHLPYGITVTRIYQTLILSAKEEEGIRYDYFLDLGVQFIPEANLKVSLSLTTQDRINQINEKIYTKYIDYDKIKDRLQIRTRRPSDFIKIGQGTKKLKKLFIDEKVPKSERDQKALITDGDEVIWIVDGRLSTAYYVTSETTRILKITVIKKDK